MNCHEVARPLCCSWSRDWHMASVPHYPGALSTPCPVPNLQCLLSTFAPITKRPLPSLDISMPLWHMTSPSSSCWEKTSRYQIMQSLPTNPFLTLLYWKDCRLDPFWFAGRLVSGLCSLQRHRGPVSSGRVLENTGCVLAGGTYTTGADDGFLSEWEWVTRSADLFWVSLDKEAQSALTDRNFITHDFIIIRNILLN